MAGWAPLLPYVFAARLLFPLSIAVTAAAFFGVGAARTLVTARGPVRAGLEMLVVGLLAAGVAYGVGNLLGGVV